LPAEPKQTSDEPEGAVPNLSFAELYKTHFAFVWRNLRRLGVPDARLRDAAQDAFLVVHRRLSEFEGRGTLEAWLYSIVRRVAADHRRHILRKCPSNPQPTEGLSDEANPDPEDQAARGEEMRLLLQFLAELDADRRELLILVDLEGLSVTEAAAVLDCNLNTAFSRLKSARHHMQAGLERYRANEWRAP
jgi:RNA polymerase sigma-70 factor (ECF subfamily)